MKSDPTAQERKNDHIKLAFEAQTNSLDIDQRFQYEPLFFQSDQDLPEIEFLGKQLQTPIWVSSMTGGTEKARKINENLARACSHFKMGMGLGSCRSLLDSNDRLEDFNLRHIIGNDLPFYANLGVAQVEQLLKLGQIDKVNQLIEKLQVDGLIIHVNPLQEWLQPEGDKFTQSPMQTIQQFLEISKIPLIIKEVGQGMGKESLKFLMKLPIQAIEFAAHGGTNFAKLELLRSDDVQQELFNSITKIGHSYTQMIEFVNEIQEENPDKVLCNQFIISGGVKNFLDGYYGMNKIQGNAVYGQASTLLKYAENSYEAVHEYIESQIKGLKLAQSCLIVKK
jgi:isopentenyl-diphosphate delta-isomerase